MALIERIQPLLKTLLLIALGIFLYSRIANGTLYYYINERFVGFTLVGIVGLLLLGLSYRWNRTSPTVEDDTHHDYTHHDYTHHDHTHHDHTHHDHSHALGWGSVFIVALPVVLGLVTTPQPLGTAALANRDVSLSMNESALPVGLRTREIASTDKTIMDWWHDFRSSPAVGQELVGQKVQVSGFVFQDERFGADHFLVTRFVVSCCVADANVLGLLVRTPADVALENDQWVEVRGSFAEMDSASTVENWHMPVVLSETITPIDVPNQPYLYP